MNFDVINYKNASNAARTLLKSDFRLPKNTHTYKIALPEKDTVMNLRFSRNGVSAATFKNGSLTEDTFGVHGSEKFVKDRFMRFLQQFADKYSS